VQRCLDTSLRWYDGISNIGIKNSRFKKVEVSDGFYIPCYRAEQRNHYGRIRQSAV